MVSERERFEQQLWELLYDLLPEGEAKSLRERLARDPEAAALYARVVRLRDLLTDALRDVYLGVVGPPTTKSVSSVSCRFPA